MWPLSPSCNVLFQRFSDPHNNFDYAPQTAIITVFSSSVEFHISDEEFRGHWMNIQRNSLAWVILRDRMSAAWNAVFLLLLRHTQMRAHPITHTQQQDYSDRLICLSWYVRDVFQQQDWRGFAHHRWHWNRQQFGLSHKSRHKLQPQVFILRDIGAINCGGRVN